MRKQYSATYKAEIVKEILREEKTLNQLASETGIHPTQLKEWKKRVLEKMPELFSRSDQAGRQLVVPARRLCGLGRLAFSRSRLLPLPIDSSVSTLTTFPTSKEDGTLILPLLLS